MKFKVKLHQLCSDDRLRPIMEHISFQDGKIIASDAHVLIVLDMDDFDISDEEKEILDGKLIHRKAFHKIWNKEVNIREDGLYCPSEHILLPWSGVEGVYPKWDRVVPHLKDFGKKEGIEAIGVNARILNKLSECFPVEIPSHKGVFDLYFTDTSTAIAVFCEPCTLKSFAIIMPKMLDESFQPEWNPPTKSFNNKK